MNARHAPAVFIFVFSLWISWAFIPPLAGAAEDFVLDNGRLRAEFDERGLVALSDLRSKRRIEFSGETASITVDGVTMSGPDLGFAEIESTPSRMAYRYVRDPVTLEVFYELRPGRDFLSKHLVYNSALRGAYHVDEVCPLTSILSLPVVGELRLKDGSWGVLCRFSESEVSSDPVWSLFAMLQNPFMSWKREGRTVSVSYSPDMGWSPDNGPFVTDRLCLGLQDLSGTRFPAEAVPEWEFVEDYDEFVSVAPFIDANEAEALMECVRAYLIYRPSRSVRVHIPWCENDYQIDVGTAEGIEEYKRIMDRAAELGCQYLLYTPANSRLSRLEDNADAWGWENLLWFGLGQNIRRDEWNPRRDEIPPSLRSMLDYAALKNLKLLAYAYPSLPFLQNPEWTKWAGDKVGGYAGADTGLRSFQDWLLDKLIAFLRTTGGAGYSFDHWWIAYDGASSNYAQWFGCRRILETLRREVPGVVIDGRQQYQNFGPWTWLAGSYPHPSLTDEQPESFKAFPDLHTDRVSANRQRFASWKYRMERFCPPEIMPGFITHQSERSDEQGVMRRDRFRPRDWDALGWKFSLLSSIATAPFNHVVNFIPARDPEEFGALSGEDIAWFRKWLDWTDRNALFLRNLRPIIGPPVLGRTDGTAAIIEDRGLVFLFNPNPGRTDARFKLDESIGLVKGERFVLRELHPAEGQLLGSPRGFWSYGAEIVISMPGREAMVFEVVPAEAEVTEPVLFNARGRVTFRTGSLNLIAGEAEMGARRTVVILIPKNQRVRAFAVNGVSYPFRQNGNAVSVDIRFAGRAFEKSQRVGTYDPSFAGGTIRARVRVPDWVFRQLEERKEGWPVSYTEDDLLAPWLAPWRLLLHAPVAGQGDSLDIAIKVNGEPVPVIKAYNSVYRRAPERTYLGSYADLSWLKPNTFYDLEVNVPSLPPGRFLGIFFENVETEYTKRILSPPSRRQ